MKEIKNDVKSISIKEFIHHDMVEWRLSDSCNRYSKVELRLFTDSSYEKVLGVEMLDDGQGISKEISHCKLVKQSKKLSESHKLVIASKRNCTDDEVQIYDNSR